MKPIKVIDEILARECVKAICKRCGRIQSHKQIHCSGCGLKYGKREKTALDAMRVAYNRELQEDICNSHALSPGYQYAVFKRTLVSAGIHRQVFIDYVLEKLNE